MRFVARTEDETEQHINAIMALFEARENLGVHCPSFDQIQEVTGLPHGTIGNILSMMVISGKLEKSGFGKWHIKKEFEE